MSADRGSDASALLILNGLPSHAQISFDAHPEAYLTNDQFAGVKSLPPGWHCISWSIASSEEPASKSEDLRPANAVGPLEGSVRNVMLRWFEQGETAVRDLDRTQQRLVLPDQPSHYAGTSSGSGIGRSTQRHLTRSFDPSSSRSAPTLLTPDVLSSVEPRLLPLPASSQARWRRVIRHLSQSDGHIGRRVVAKVLGLDSASGDSITDSLATGPSRPRDSKEEASLQHTGNLGRKEHGKKIWGKSRPEAELESAQLFEVEVEVDGDATDGDLDSTEPRKRKRSTIDTSATGEDHLEEEGLLFTAFDLRRSWPPNSVGADLTRWSEDKSWLLQDVAKRSHLGIPAGVNHAGTEDDWYLPILCEFELAFILFLMANNAYAWEQWKDLFALFCRSSSLIGASSAFQEHPAVAVDSSRASASTTDAESPRLDAHVAFLEMVTAQIDVLDSDFWSTQTTTTEEQAVLKELDILRASIARSLSAAGVGPDQEIHDGSREKLVAAWRRLSHLSASKFDWNLDRRLDEEAEVEDDIQAEEGEDAPIVVDI